MPTPYDRDEKYLHPLLRQLLPNLLQVMKQNLPVGITAKAISMHRTPTDQFELFKQGRKFSNGRWAIVERSKVVTFKDGFVSLSRHNYLPGTAFDTGLFQGSDYLEESPHYKVIGIAAHQLNLDWGGDWSGFVDKPHIEIPLTRFFQGSIQKDVARQWQKYLRRAGTYTKALDGIFGPASTDALEAETGQRERNIKTWELLFNKFGPVENLLDA